MATASRMEVLALCVQRGGYRKGRQVAQFIAEWELAVRDVGRELSPEEFWPYWKESRSKTYRRLTDFRAMFPELGPHGKPDDLMAPLLKRLRAGEQVKGDVRLVVPT